MSFPANGIPGIDVSHWQGVVDWHRVAAAGEQFALCKATDGTTTVDPYFHDNWANIKAAGLLRGIYHFFHPSQDAGAQADFFLAKFAAANGNSTQLAPGDLPVALDLEITSGSAANDILAGANTWLQKVAAATGRKPFLYTNSAFWTHTLGNPNQFSEYPLWAARYSSSPPPTMGGWPAYTIWQYSQSLSVDGIGGPVDGDSFNGTQQALRALAGL